MLMDDLVKEKMLALKEHNTAKRSVMENVTGKALLLKIEKREKNEELTDDDVIKIIQKVIKELEEEKEAFSKAGREEKVAELNEQINLISVYLPKQLTDEEIINIINNQEDKSMPSIMKYFKLNYAGKVDMKKVSQIINNINK